MNPKLLGLAACAALSGCVASRPRPPAAATPTLVVQPISAAAFPATSDTAPPAEARPIYQPPKIGRIYLRAHEDASGRLLGPQVIYQIIEPGGWNLDALDRTVPEPAQVFDPNASWFLIPEPPANLEKTPPESR